MMKLYLTRIRSYPLDLAIKCSAFADLRLAHAIQEIKSDYNEPEDRTQTPLIYPFLLCILNCLAFTNYDDVVLKAAFTLCFPGFLPVGEFTYKQGH